MKSSKQRIRGFDMIVRCEICGKRISRKVFNSRQTTSGNAKNMGECDLCTDEHREKITSIFKEIVVVTDDAVYIGNKKIEVRQ